MWPELPYASWKETLDTLHMWMQIVGKVKLSLAPFINEWWEVAFYITATGITSGPIPYEGKFFQIDLNFFNHTLVIHMSNGKSKSLSLKPCTVASFYGEFFDLLRELAIKVSIWPVPVEVVHPIPFKKDTVHGSYDKAYVNRWWHTLIAIHIVFWQFRSTFHGKSSPIHFFWGSFDLSCSLFSGKRAKPPKLQGVMGKIMRFSEDEENFTFGFWPGDEKYSHPAIFSYMYPQPADVTAIKLAKGASFNEQLSLFILPYEFFRKTEDPKSSILFFLQSTYKKCATLAGWDMQSLRAKVPHTR